MINPWTYPDGSHTLTLAPIDPDGIFQMVRDNATDKIYFRCTQCNVYSLAFDALALKARLGPLKYWHRKVRLLLLSPYFIIGGLAWARHHRQCFRQVHQQSRK